MALYIKANTKVAQYLHLENDRNFLQDGNFLLWQADMLAFGKLIDLPVILEQIGGIALRSNEAREEQDGTVLRPLPVATDPRFVIEVPVKETKPAERPGKDPEAGQEQAPEDQQQNGEVAEDPAPDPVEDPAPAEEQKPAAEEVKQKNGKK